MSLGGRAENGGEREVPRSPPSTPRLKGISITLSGAQVGRVLREVTGTSGSRGVLLEHVDDLRLAVHAALANPQLDERQVSRSTLRALGVLCAFAPLGTVRGINEVGRELGMSHSSAYRYGQTLVAVGLLEQLSHGRKYRIPPPTGRADTPED